MLAFAITSDVVRGERIGYQERFWRLTRQLVSRERAFRWFDQPVLYDANVGLDAYIALLDTMESFCKSSGLAVSSSPLPASIMNSLPAGWLRSEWATIVVDLRKNEEDLWRDLKKTARKAVRRARDDGIRVRKIESLDELRSYSEFASRCAARYGKKVYLVDFELSWDQLKPHAIYETFVAEMDSEPIAGLSVWGYNGIISEFGSFQSELSYSQKLYGADLIKWEVILWAAKQGCRYYDLAGVSPHPKTEKEAGIRQFKEKWGGEYRPYALVSQRRLQS